MLCGNFEIKVGDQWRIVIPKQFRNSLKGEIVVVAGCGDHIEIWTKDKWESELLKSRKLLDKVLN